MKNPGEYIPSGLIEVCNNWYDELNESIKQAQKEAYNQGIEDSRLKIKYDFRQTTVDTPTNNAGYCSRSGMFMDFMMNYEDSILKLKIK